MYYFTFNNINCLKSNKIPFLYFNILILIKIVLIVVLFDDDKFIWPIENLQKNISLTIRGQEVYFELYFLFPN